MEALSVNTWLAPAELAISEAFLAILNLEYRGVKLKVKMELRPLHRNDLHCVLIEWESPSTIELFRCIQRSCNEFCVKRINIILDNCTPLV